MKKKITKPTTFVPSGACFVRLAATGNPDHREYYGEGVLAPTQKVAVKHIDEAIAACFVYINEHDLGGGNWTGGQVTDAAGNEIANISYNGNVWAPGKWKPGVEPIYTPKVGLRGEMR